MPAPHPFTPPGQLPHKTPAVPDAARNATATDSTAGGADLIGSLYGHALGPVQADYYLPRFNRQAASARPLPAWNSAAAFATLGWLGLRRLWVPAGIYAGVLAVCLGGWVALRAQVPLAVEATLVLLGALLLTVLPGLFANALYHRVIHHHTMRALQQSGTIAQAAQTLAQYAVTPERVRRAAMAHAAVTVLLVALTAAALYWRSASSGAEQTPSAPAVPAAPAFGPPTLHFPALATQTPPQTQTQAQQPPGGDTVTGGAVVTAPVVPAPALPPVAMTADATASAASASVSASVPAAVPSVVAGSSAALPDVATAPQVSHTAPVHESAPLSVPLPVSAAQPAAAAPVAQPPAPAVQAQTPSVAQTTAAMPVAASASPVATSPVQPSPTMPAPVAAAAPSAPAVVDALTPAQTVQNSLRATTQPAVPTTPAPATASASTPPRAAAAPAARPRATDNRSNTLIVGRYYLHAGVFGDERNVQRNSQNLRREGLPVITQRVRGSKGELTRLRIGPFDTRAQAQDAQRITNRLRLETSIFQHK